MIHLNKEEIKHVCSRLLTYEEDSTSIKGLISVVMEECVESMGPDYEPDLSDIQEKANLIIIDSQIRKLNSMGLLEIELDENGEEICFVPENLALELSKEEKNESCRN